ncbi:hypothetical protein [Mesorhizobium sp. B2-4-12]|uniref:hypothetical protein n=1 Tax=Mesorhizobium sp. B2-4-12 TaxID=2589937 RepID=UPI0015E2ACCF|nr:hypothetical protein [Mesorhizobium sp. B2-4-12]
MVVDANIDKTHYVIVGDEVAYQVDAEGPLCKYLGPADEFAQDLGWVMSDTYLYHHYRAWHRRGYGSHLSQPANEPPAPAFAR